NTSLPLYQRDLTLRTVFTHDHFGPSSHQQAGLYAGLVIEPVGSIWRHGETNVQLGTRTTGTFPDGGPTSWQAMIIKQDPANTHREFMFEFADFQLAYKEGRGVGVDGKPIPDPGGAIFPPECPQGFSPPCPEAISAMDTGTMTVNYRNEPVALRIRNPNTNTQAGGAAGDLSKVYKSNVDRADPDFNV